MDESRRVDSVMGSVEAIVDGSLVAVTVIGFFGSMAFVFRFGLHMWKKKKKIWDTEVLSEIVFEVLGYLYFES